MRELAHIVRKAVRALPLVLVQVLLLLQVHLLLMLLLLKILTLHTSI